MTLALLLACGVSACQSVPSEPRPSSGADTRMPPAEMPPPAPPENDVDAPSSAAVKPEPAEAPACTCVDSTSKPPPKRKPKPALPAPPPAMAAAAAACGEARVNLEASPSTSILGRKVRAQDETDFGRVVDILADREGRVRSAIIEFGGFLGVGNRRIAVEWSLLKFQSGDADAPIVVNASKARLQEMPEYKGGERPPAASK